MDYVGFKFTVGDTVKFFYDGKWREGVVIRQRVYTDYTTATPLHQKPKRVAGYTIRDVETKTIHDQIYEYHVCSVDKWNTNNAFANLGRINLTISSEDLKNLCCCDDSKIVNHVYRPYNKYEPKQIIYNNPATIVFWKDGTKTVVKKAKGEKYNEYNAFCAALAKKIFGNNSKLTKVVKSGIHQNEKKEKK